MELITVTIRTASRVRMGQGDFQEVGLSLSFSTRDEPGSSVNEVVDQAGDVLEQAFHQLLRRLDDGLGS